MHIISFERIYESSSLEEACYGQHKKIFRNEMTDTFYQTPFFVTITV